MEERNTHTLHIESIRAELNRILDEWLHLHYRLTVILVLIACAVEIGMAFFIAQSDILTTTVQRYILKFIVAPSGLALVCLMISTTVIRSKTASYRAKVYVVSLMFVAVCFIYYSAHSAFIAIYALYAVAIFLTTTYADYKLTGLVSALSIVSLVVSELFLKWDTDKVGALDNANQLVQMLVALSVIIGCALVSAVTIRYERRKNEASLKREVERELMKESLLYDELTGSLNRKALHEEIKLLERTPPTAPLVFGIADIDHFKSVNDLYGHHVGDLCLMEFACILGEYFG
jgi:diguanylate cyclase